MRAVGMTFRIFCFTTLVWQIRDTDSGHYPLQRGSDRYPCVLCPALRFSAVRWPLRPHSPQHRGIAERICSG